MALASNFCNAPHEFVTDAKIERRMTVKRITILLGVVLILLAATVLATIRAGAQQAVVTDDNLEQSITSAKTPADHEAIAVFYEQQALDAKKKAAIHRNTAAIYRKLNIAKPVGMAEMCDNIAAMWDKIAADNSKLAKAHQAMAKKED